MGSSAAPFRMNRRLAAAGGGVAVFCILGMLGFWKSSSPLYWRAGAQATLFFSARHAPASLQASLTRAALLAHVSGTTYDELAEATTVLEAVRERHAAAVLALALARMDAQLGDVDGAIVNARYSYAQSPSSKANAALIILNDAASAARARWVAELGTHYPRHELAYVFDCTRQLRTFEGALPAPCRSVDWLLASAESGYVQYGILTRQIAALPTTTEYEVAKIRGEEEALESRIASIDASLESGGYVDVVLGDLLPSDGQSLGDWAVETAACALPIIELLCAARTIGSIGEEYNRREALTNERAQVTVLWTRAEGRIAYWHSPGPLQELTAARDRLIAEFRLGVETNITSRRPEIGLGVREAIAAAAARL